MRPSPDSSFDPPECDRPLASLDGPSRTIRVEPLETPVPAPPPRVDPAPVRDPPPTREPERPREPAR